MESCPALSTYAFSTDFGWMAIAWAEERLFGLTFGHPSKTAAQSTLDRILCTDDNCSHKMQHASTTGADYLIDRLRDYAAGEPVDFDDVEVDMSHLTPFGQRVTAACRDIPRGKTRTYGRLAAECRRPGAARAVGSVMAKNRFPLVVPCHRVVGASGSLGGFSAPQGLRMKQRLLDLESLTPLAMSMPS